MRRAVIALAVALGGCGATPTPQLQPACHARGPLPDAHCTPGAVDPHVTQANIARTICVRGYTKRVRPPVAYTNALKLDGIRAYGYADTRPQDYEEDHLISLELGGAPRDPRNLWPEPGGSPNAKDAVENRLRREVCQGKLSLQQAQRQISTDWRTAP